MKKQSAFRAWPLLMLSLPKGIAAFVIAITGLCAGLPLSIVWIGLPLLAATLAACRRMMETEEQLVTAWSQGEELKVQPTGNPPILRWEGWRSLVSQLRQGQSYRAILYSIAQLPIGIIGFTLAIVLPVTSFAVMLSPLAFKISNAFFSYDLFGSKSNYFLFYVLPDLSSFERSWVAGGLGLGLMLLQPLIFRNLGRLYAAWVRTISGT